MTDLGLTPSQTVGPYLSLSLHRLITPELVDPAIRARCASAARSSTVPASRCRTE